MELITYTHTHSDKYQILWRHFELCLYHPAWQSHVSCAILCVNNYFFVLSRSVGFIAIFIKGAIFSWNFLRKSDLSLFPTQEEFNDILRTYVGLHLKRLLFRRILLTLVPGRHISVTGANTKFHENSSSWSLLGPCRRTYIHTYIHGHR
jgi:hypothetical protein